jgi:hypothetical protein
MNTSKGCKFAQESFDNKRAQKKIRIMGKKILGEYGRGINLILRWLNHSIHKAELLLIQGHSTIRREQTHSFTQSQIT